MRRRGLAEYDSDPLGTGVYDPLHIGAAECRTVVVTSDLCEDKVGYLLDHTVVISIPIHKRNPIVSPFIFHFDAVDLAYATLVPLFGQLGSDECSNDLFSLIERALSAAERKNIRTVMLA